MKPSDLTILLLIGGFFAGIILHSYIGFSFASTFLFLITSIALSVVFFLEKERIFLCGALCLFGIFCGLFRYNLSEPKTLGLESFVGQKVVAEGVLYAEGDVRESSTRLALALDTVNGKPVSEKILAIAPRYPLFAYGDRVKISGTISRPENFETDDGKLFDYESYLAKDNIFYVMRFATVEKVSSGNGWWIQEKLFAMKNAFVASFQEVLGEPHSSLLAGLLVGDKKSLGENITEDFRRAGLIHIVVLSGYNITIVAESIIKAFSFLPGFSSGFGVVGIILFALMTGASATVVRASLMALIALFARQIGRLYDITRALLFAAFIMILVHPKLLVFDMSFQLSFLATMGLIYFSPIAAKYLSKIQEKIQLKLEAIFSYPRLRETNTRDVQARTVSVVVGTHNEGDGKIGRVFREIISATVATQIFVLPFLLTKIGQVSVVSLFSNILVLPIIPPTMFIGFITGLLGFLSPIIATPPGFIAHLALSWILFVSHFFASLPFAQISIPFFPWWLAVVCYVGFGYLFYRETQKEKTAEIDAAVSP